MIPAPPLINLTPPQIDYLNDELHRFIIAAAGRRSRKTLIAKRKILYRALENPDTIWFHGAPTYKQAKDLFWDDLKLWTKHIRVHKSDSDLFVKLKNGSEIHAIGLDRPERIEGRTKSWNGCHLAEFGDMKPEAWESNIRPVLADTGGSVIIDGVPDPFKSGFANHKRLAQYACGGSIPTIEPFHGAFADNGDWAFYSWFSSDVLPASEMKDIQETTDPQTFEIEYRPSFQSVTGMVYYAYTPDYHPNGNLDNDVKYDKNLPIIMAFDFNVSPMTAVLGHVRNVKNKQEWHLFKGYFLKNSNTKQLIDRIIDEHPETNTFYLTPCQSSIARQSSQELTSEGYRTDLAVIKDAMKNCASGTKNLIIKKRPKNPLIYRRIRATNTMLSSKRLRINPNDIGLKELIRDFEELSYKEGTSQIDDSDVMRNHISAAVGYACEKYWPVKRETGDKHDVIL